MERKTCCFTGHKQLPQERIEDILKHLNDELDELISQGVTNFLSGGARGFDLLAAALVIAKKELGREIRLVFALPCRDQDALWPTAERDLFRRLLGRADAIHYVSEECTLSCLRLRNQYLAEQSDYCICALLHPFSGTAQTVRYARKKRICIINVAADPSRRT